jgi:hypothetical protein
MQHYGVMPRSEALGENGDEPDARNRFTPMRRCARMVGLVLALGLTGLIGISSYSYWSLPFASTPREFSEEAWRESNRFRRQVMAQDFLNRHARDRPRFQQKD